MLEEEKKQAERSLEETEAELTTAQEKLNSAKDELRRVRDAGESIVELEDKVEQPEWQREKADKSHEMSLLPAKHQLRRELSEAHAQEGAGSPGLFNSVNKGKGGSATRGRSAHL